MLRIINTISKRNLPTTVNRCTCRGAGKPGVNGHVQSKPELLKINVPNGK